MSASGEDYRPPPADSLLRLLWPSVESSYDEAFQASPADTSPETSPEWLLPARRLIEPGWTLPDVDFSGVEDMRQDLHEAGEPVEFHWVGTEARIAGTVVHRWLQLAAEREVGLDVDDLATCRPTTERWLREMGVGAGSIGSIRARVDAALEGVLGDEKGRWLLEGDGHSELPLTGLVAGRVVSGIIDRVRIDDDGTHWIVDYKSSTHEGGNLEGFLQAEADRYRPQLGRYATLYRAYAAEEPRCALYFPLLREFLEVPVG